MSYIFYKQHLKKICIHYNFNVINITLYTNINCRNIVIICLVLGILLVDLSEPHKPAKTRKYRNHIMKKLKNRKRNHFKGGKLFL